MSKKCCICATVKNCGKYLDFIFLNINCISKIFDDYRVIMYYDASTDNTLQKLIQYKNANPKFTYYENTNQMYICRTHNIAKGRNYCIQTIKNSYPDYEYFIMMDCDEVCATPIKINILSEYLLRNDWDSLSFNRINYYDIWALSFGPFAFSCWHFNINVKTQWGNIGNLLNNMSPEQLFQCYSAFNGFAIYRTNKFINCYYDGKIRLDIIPTKLLEHNIKLCGKIQHFKRFPNEDCEHRHFHYQAILTNGARIRISPKILFF
jgi:hypothetical protein